MTLTQNQNIEVATEKVETLLGSWDISLMFIYCGTNRVAYTLFVPQYMKCFKWHDYNRGTLLYNRGSTNFDKNLVYFFWKKCEDDIENWTSTIGKLYIYIYSLFTTTQKGNVKGVPYMPEMQLESEWQLYF